MELAIIMLLAMTPVFWWAFKEARENLKEDRRGRPSTGSPTSGVSYYESKAEREAREKNRPTTGSSTRQP